MAPDPKSFLLDNVLHTYLVTHSTPHDDIVDDLVRETAALGPESGMQIAPEEGQLLSLLVRLTGATRIVEVGTFTGFSSLCMARALPEGGRLLCCDVHEEWTSIARRYWERAGVADRIELALGPAAATLAALPADYVVDMSFIDADKQSYITYYEELIARTRPGGIVLIDNTLWSGRVVDPEDHSDNVEAIRRLNDHVATDPRVDCVLLPVADGLTLIRKR